MSQQGAKVYGEFAKLRHLFPDLSIDVQDQGYLGIYVTLVLVVGKRTFGQRTVIQPVFVHEPGYLRREVVYAASAIVSNVLEA